MQFIVRNTSYIAFNVRFHLGYDVVPEKKICAVCKQEFGEEDNVKVKESMLSTGNYHLKLARRWIIDHGWNPDTGPEDFLCLSCWKRALDETSLILINTEVSDSCPHCGVSIPKERLQPGTRGRCIKCGRAYLVQGADFADEKTSEELRKLRNDNKQRAKEEYRVLRDR